MEKVASEIYSETASQLYSLDTGEPNSTMAAQIAGFLMHIPLFIEAVLEIEPRTYPNVNARDYQIDVVTYTNSNLEYPYTMRHYVDKEGKIIWTELINDMEYYIQ